MKIVAVDNFNRESIADILIAENVKDIWAEYLAKAANEHNPGDRFFKAFPDDYVLWRGMEELA
jgi:hypothetical protein